MAGEATLLTEYCRNYARLVPAYGEVENCQPLLLSSCFVLELD